MKTLREQAEYLQVLIIRTTDPEERKRLQDEYMRLCVLIGNEVFLFDWEK